MRQLTPDPRGLGRPATEAPSAVELRHLRYLVALADAGNFTRAAERMFIAQPTLSQQIRRLEQFVGTPLLQRRPEGVRLTAAGAMLLETSREVLSLVDWGMSRTRQAAGLGRPRLRMVVPPGLPDALAGQASATLRRAAGAAEVDVVWLETPLDAEFSPIRERRADAGIGWLAAGPQALSAPLDGMSLGEFEPDVWVPAAHPAARFGMVSVGDLARMAVIYGPRRAVGGTHDAWTRVLREENPGFEFTDPPLRHSLPVVLAFAAFADRPAAVLTAPARAVGARLGPDQVLRVTGAADMVRVSVEGRRLTTTAALVWNGELPSPLQQVLFDTADGFGAGDVAAGSPAGDARGAVKTALACAGNGQAASHAGWPRRRDGRP